MTEYLQAWQCIGCGRLEAPQNCIGICQDRKVRFVYAEEYEAVQAELEAVRRDNAALLALVRRLARTTPREGEWERSFRAFQGSAARLLTRIAG